MIRSVVVPHFIGSETDFERFKQALAALGFSPGEGWNDDRGTGAPYLTGSGAIELFRGQAPVPADLLVEVEDVQRAFRVVREHGLECTPELQQTHWNATYFIVSMGDRRVAFFQFNREPAAA